MTGKRDIKTGVDQLDSDLRALFDLVGSDELRKVKEAIANKELSPKDFGRIVPRGVLRLALILTPPLNFKLTLHKCEDGAHELLEEARRLIREHFPDIDSHPAVFEIVKPEIAATQEQQKGASWQLNVISRLTVMTTFLGPPPKLTPAVRIAFRDKPGKLLLDSLMNWDDVLFVSQALADIAADEFESSKKLAELDLLDLDDDNRKELAKHINKLGRHMERLRQAAPVYGIDLQASLEEDSDRDDPD